MERLEPPVAEATPTPAVEHGRRAYRELYITIAVVVAALAGTIAYQLAPSPPAKPAMSDGASPVGPRPEAPSPGQPPRPEERPDTAPSPAPPAKRRTTADQPTRRPPPAATAKPAVAPSATPMLSIVSTPNGAIVSIDGVIYGRTPLIMPGPPDKDSLAVTLKLSGHRNFSKVLTKTEAGHFSLNVKLKPNRTRP